MKAIVFAYHDIGCVGLEALKLAGYEIQAVFTHSDAPGENHFYASVAKGLPRWTCRCLRRKTLTIRSG